MKLIKNSLVYLLCAVVHAASFAADGQIIKVDEGLYTAKVPQRDLYAVMERITDDNVSSWRNYAKVQADSFTKEGISHRYGLNVYTGSHHFKDILNENVYQINEVWVAYITSNPTIQHILDNVKGYDIDQMLMLKNNFAKDIKMFVTVTSDPNAIFSTHTGIATTLENLENKNPVKGISMNLHAFAARAMRTRNPKLKFMVNAPVDVMAKILLNSLPKGSVFVGTREMQQEIEAAKKLDFDTFKIENQRAISEIKEKNLKNAKRSERNLNEDLQSRLFDMQEGETPAQIRQELAQESDAKNYLTLNPEGVFVISQEKLNKKIEEAIYNKFQTTKNIYGHLQSLMQENPPIISFKEGRFIIYDPKDPQKILVDIDLSKSLPTYYWMFVHVYEQLPQTVYIATDLERLANSNF